MCNIEMCSERISEEKGAQGIEHNHMAQAVWFSALLPPIYSYKIGIHPLGGSLVGCFTIEFRRIH